MSKHTRPPRPRTMMVAMVIGTALSALHGHEADAATKAGPGDEHVIRDISRYCQACWRNARLPQDDWTDCTQEVFIRLLERVERAEWGRTLRHDGEERRELVRAIDAVKKRSQRRRKGASLPGEVSDHRPAESARNRDWEEIDRLSTSVLSSRQRRVMALSRDGWSVPEIAEYLDTSPERVSDEKYKAIRKLRRELGVSG